MEEVLVKASAGYMVCFQTVGATPAAGLVHRPSRRRSKTTRRHWGQKPAKALRLVLLRRLPFHL